MGNFSNRIPIRPVDEPAEMVKQKSSEVDFNDNEARVAWTNAFIQEEGFKSVVEALVKWEGTEDQIGFFDLKQLNFMITLVKVFLISAFTSANESQNFKLEK